jgi:quercetin dioxygenase-like cupin family protein
MLHGGVSSPLIQACLVQVAIDPPADLVNRRRPRRKDEARHLFKSAGMIHFARDRVCNEEAEMSSSDLFVSAEGAEWVNPEPGVVRRIMTYLPEMMMVEVVFESGAVGAAHSHPHIQASYVAEGSFEVTIDGRTEVLRQGGSFIVPPNLVHGVKALEKGRLIDAFTPHRAEFLK